MKSARPLGCRQGRGARDARGTKPSSQGGSPWVLWVEPAAAAIVSLSQHQNLRRRPTQVRRSFLLRFAGVERRLTFGSALLVCWSGDATVDVPWPRRFGSFHRSKRGFGSSVTDPRQYVSVTQFYLCQLVRPRSDRHGRPPPCIPIALPAQRAPVCPERLHRCGRCIHATEK